MGPLLSQGLALSPAGFEAGSHHAFYSCKALNSANNPGTSEENPKIT